MTSEWDAYASALNRLFDKKETNAGRILDAEQAIYHLIETLHNLDHKTNHKSTYTLFEDKVLMLHYKRMICNHWQDQYRWGTYELSKEDVAQGIRKCEVCKMTMHKDVIKERYGIQVK